MKKMVIDLIESSEINLETFERLFQSMQLSTAITEVYPADAGLHLDRDAYLTVNYPDSLPVIVWFDTQVRSLLRFRVVVFKRKELEEFTREEMEFLPTHGELANQQLNFFGALSTGGLDITLEYKLPYGERILGSTITLVAQHISRGGKLAKEVLS
ncbi:MAG: hypothetical protein K9K38_16385 [Rhodoferax sp.]|nr:hypothetical protein [Rhodoferax sp.]MCF8210956.1 hypothetical protein [Rhodoferax sp.]